MRLPEKAKLFFKATLRVIRLVWRGFLDDRCDLHASALTYYAMMSLVPFLAFGLSLAQVFGAGDVAKELILGKIDELCLQISSQSGANDSAVVTQLTSQINEYTQQIFESISNVSFNTLGAVGLITLLWTSIAMLSSVEQSFNSVWHAPERTLWRKVADYVTIIMVVPFLAITASSIPIIAKIVEFAEVHAPGFLSTEILAKVLRNGVTGTLMVMLFSILLIFVPNTKVKAVPGIVGGVVTAVIFTIWFKICIALQVGVARNSAIYGGFAALPILLAWAYISWQIMLFGAELTLAIQRQEAFFRDEGANDACGTSRALLALALVVEMARRMINNDTPLNVTEYTRVRGISDRLALDVMGALVNVGIAAATQDQNDGESYVLLRIPDKLTVGETIFAFSSSGTPAENLGLNNIDSAIRTTFDKGCSAMLATQTTTIAELAQHSNDKKDL